MAMGNRPYPLIDGFKTKRRGARFVTNGCGCEPAIELVGRHGDVVSAWSGLTAERRACREVHGLTQPS
jgi:hypothetical protein